MIRDFWVENYYSIKERQEMNFEVRFKEDEWMRVEPTPGVYLSKLGIIYGANASGKSNMLKAMQNVFDLLFTSRSNRNDPVLSGMPFALTADKPTKMYVSFFVEGVRYDYLVGIKSKTIDALIQNTLNNHTVLSTYGKVALPDDAEPMAKLYDWIRDHVHGVLKMNDGDVLPQMREVDADAKRKKFYMQMLKKADFNISDFHVLSNGRDETVAFVNTTSSEDFELPDSTQSAGTIRFIADLKYLYDAITGSHIYMLDELGEDLHYDLLLYYINVFLYNSDSSQLIMTSQETSLLAEDLINEHRQVVWFAEKSHETASSVYTRADKFGLHKNLSLYNSYRIGRLGAKPELGSPFGKQRNTTIIIGEGPTEFYYLNSLKDEFRILQHIKPDSPKNTSLRELQRSIKSSIQMGYSQVFCLIDMDTKKKDAKSMAEYQRLKKKYHNVHIVKKRSGIDCQIRFYETERCTELFFIYYFKYTRSRVAISLMP